MSMLLTGDNGTEFELALIEDRLPEIQDGFGDDAPVTILFRATTPDLSWEETAPCLNTFEIQTLLEWLSAVSQGAAGGPDEAEVEIIEPQLRFAVVRDTGDSIVLRISFNLEDAPPELTIDPPTSPPDEADHIDLRISRERIRAAVAELRRDLQEMEVTEEIAGQSKDDLRGERPMGEVRTGDEDLDILDRLEDEPEGMGSGEDNAGER